MAPVNSVATLGFLAAVGTTAVASVTPRSLGRVLQDAETFVPAAGYSGVGDVFFGFDADGTPNEVVQVNPDGSEEEAIVTYEDETPVVVEVGEKTFSDEGEVGATPAPTTATDETPAPTTADSETPAPTTATDETPAPTTADLETPAPTTADSETPAPTTADLETPAPTTADSETPAPETPAPSVPPARRRTQIEEFNTCNIGCVSDINKLCGFLEGLCFTNDLFFCGFLGNICSTTAIESTCSEKCTCESDDDCDGGDICCPDDNVCVDPASGACGDPHMTGFRGQKFDFTGEDGAWYCMLEDGPSLHVNMRVTSPVPSVPEITYITGLSVITTDDDGDDHTIEVSVTNPQSLASVCPAGVSPCLADGALTVALDGEESLLSPGKVTLGPGVAISAANLPGACRSFGFDKYWERKKLETAKAGRRLEAMNVLMDMGEWILGDPTATNLDECTEYVAMAGGDDALFNHASEHVSFQILTPAGTIRLSHGRLHQIAMRDPTDQYDLPDHLTWQMNVAIDHYDVSRGATGILGETVVPTVDVYGAPIMEGIHAIRGSQEDYRVEGPAATAFAQGSRHE